MVKRIKKQIPRADGEMVEVEVEEGEDTPEGAPTVEELGMDMNALFPDVITWCVRGRARGVSGRRRRRRHRH